MANMFQIAISNIPAGTATDLGVAATNAVVVQNFSRDLSVVIGIGSSSSPPSGVFAGDAVFDQVTTTSGWVLKPGEISPKINLTAGQHLYAAVPEADSSVGALEAKLQVYTDFP